jgi:hypothetical protein
MGAIFFLGGDFAETLMIVVLGVYQLCSENQCNISF